MSAAVTSPAPVAASRTRSDRWAGTGVLLRLALRRDRWLIPGWALGLAAMTGFSAAATADLYPDLAERVVAAEVVNSTASLVALYGRIYDVTSLGALSLFKLTGFGTALVAVLVAVITVRHSRAEEEAGRLELLGAGVLGRGAPLAAALGTAAIASVTVGLLTTLALLGVGLPAPGSVAFGASWAATAMVFGAVAAITAQVTTSARTANGLAITAIGIAYAMRAVGDLSDPPSLLTWLSPIGWGQQVRPFAGEQWWVLLLSLAVAGLLSVFAFRLRSRRDLGGGLLPERAGPAQGRLGSPWRLAVRLSRASLTGWAVAFAMFGLLLGSLATTVSDFISSEAFRQIIEALGGEQALVDAFLAAELSILGIIAAAYGIAAAHHLRSEEAAGRTELLLAGRTTRIRWAGSHLLAAGGGVAVLMAVAGIGVGVGYAISVGDPGESTTVLAAALVQVPAGWSFVAAAVAVFGWLPRLTAAVWGLFVAAVVIGEFGTLWGLPQAVIDLSPFVHVPRLPVGTDDLPMVLLMLAIGAAISALGLWGFRRRDLAP